jgi:transposase
MSSRELERVEVMGRVDSGALKLKDAAAMLELSYRQAKRLWRRYREVGGKGLQHGNAGRPSNRSKPLKLRRRVLNLIKKKYSGSEEERFGPTLASEHLAEEDGIAIDHETLRGWMLAEGLWSRQRRRKKHCQRRERKSHFGELVQLDGSFHDWLEQRGPRGCLMDMVDDAAGTVQAGMGKEETIWAAVGVLRAWIGKYGIPRGLYTDWKNVYKRKVTATRTLPSPGLRPLECSSITAAETVRSTLARFLIPWTSLADCLEHGRLPREILTATGVPISPSAWNLPNRS